MSGCCKVRFEDYVEYQRCALPRGHDGDHQTRFGKSFPVRAEMERRSYAF